MDAYRHHWTLVLLLLSSAHSVGPNNVTAGGPQIQFDLPAIAAAADTASATGTEVTVGFAVSSLVDQMTIRSDDNVPPIDHMLIHCRLRDGSPIINYAPRTELQSEFAGPISVTEKDEQSDSFGLSLDANIAPFGLGHLGADETQKSCDSTQFQRQAPLQAVIAAGTTHRGRGVYFKLRWTAQQVLEGEKRFQITFAVPTHWRGGLMDVQITAHTLERNLLGGSKRRQLQRNNFVVAVHRQSDPGAAKAAERLAELDRKLVAFAHEHQQNRPALADWWNRVVNRGESTAIDDHWYRLVTVQQANPHVDERIRSLPMPIRIAVLDYAEASRELMQLAAAEDRKEPSR